MSEHPAHPALVHYPFAFLTTSYALDLIYGLATNPSTSKSVLSLYNVGPYLQDISKFSHYLNILGLLSAVPAILSGGQQLMLMIKKQDLAAKLEKSQNKSKTVQGIHPKLKLGFAHAGLMDITVAASAYNWYTRRGSPNFVPDELNIYLAAALLLVMFGSAYLGGAMVYEHAVGVKVGGARRIKEQ